MKSILIIDASYIPKSERAKYSDLQVMKSAAGFYIGTTYNNEEGFQEPGSRDSCYFHTKEVAEKVLAEWIRINKEHGMDLLAYPGMREEF